MKMKHKTTVLILSMMSFKRNMINNYSPVQSSHFYVRFVAEYAGLEMLVIGKHMNVNFVALPLIFEVVVAFPHKVS